VAFPIDRALGAPNAALRAMPQLPSWLDPTAGIAMLDDSDKTPIIMSTLLYVYVTVSLPCVTKDRSNSYLC
jgi:hypothetical protein